MSSLSVVPPAGVATGLMRLTWAPEQTPDEQAFELMKTAIDAGSTSFNSGYFYGNPPDVTTNLQLISRFCEAHPDYKDRFYLSVKGGMTKELKPRADIEFLRAQMQEINSILKHRKMDLFEMARVDREVGIEESMKILLKLRDEGLFRDIGLSEVSADTLRKAVSVGPVAAVEIEYSPFCLDIEKNGVLAAAKEAKVPLVAYSPLGAGFLGNTWTSKEDIPEGDFRRTFDKFSDEHFEHNMQLVRKLTAIAEKKGITPAQLSIAWVRAQDPLVVPLPGSTKPARVEEAIEAGKVQLSSAELDEIRQTLDSFSVKGVRYSKNPHMQDMLEG
ncbi:aldo/keto reductase family protein [Rhodotorula paludigena]|uniref:aldo/keto reductase family protein n=1 Tax=Rhodotorula paludigena TaxID=86838 RepID=UPI0031717C13